MFKYVCTLVTLLLFTSIACFAQNSILNVGLRLQKTVNLYHENGIAIEYSSKVFKPDRVYFGFSYVTSRLGTAYRSNAIKQDNYLLSAAYYFRQGHVIRPVVRLNTGYFSASYGHKIFDDLPQSSLILSGDAGVAIQTHSPLKFAATLGYNTITGNGVKGPGTLYPVFYQLTISWNLLSHQK